MLKFIKQYKPYKQMKLNLLWCGPNKIFIIVLLESVCLYTANDRLTDCTRAEYNKFWLKVT